MITELVVRRFKSIKELDVPCRKVNLFIGEPNAGKSNILEVLGLLSTTAYGNFDQFIRFEHTSNLYYDDIVDAPVEIFGKNIESNGSSADFELSIDFVENEFRGTVKYDQQQQRAFTADYGSLRSYILPDWFSFVKFYKYSPLDNFPAMEAGSLLPPDGQNLFSLIKSRKNVREMVVNLLGNFGLKLMLRVREHKIEAAKQVDELLFTYPYVTLSDTLKRMIFYITAMETNKDSTLIFEEPESSSFPFYTKDLAERIGLDKGGNQFFITTHNPYFLESIIEKTPEKDLAVNLTYYRDYETKVKLLSSEDLSDLLDTEPFFNLDRYVSD